MNNKKSIFQLIERLKDINVSQVFESTKSFSIDDLKKIKWEDIRKSKYVSPVSGISLAIILIITLFIPQYKGLRRLQSVSNRFSIESNSLSMLEDEINRSLEISNQIEPEYKKIISLIPNKSTLVNLTALITDAAKRSLVDITEFSPIKKDELASCTASSNEESYGYEDSMSLDINNFDDNPDNEFDLGFNEEIPGPNTTQDGQAEDIELQNKLDYIVNNSQLLDSLISLDNESYSAQAIEDNYEMNYFKVMVKADYTNLLNFLRTIQEYKIITLPVCFEPKATSPTSGVGSALNTANQNSGLVQARILINIPTLNNEKISNLK